MGTPDSITQEYGVLIVDVRAMTPGTMSRQRLFGLAGLAAVRGLSFGWSPVLGMGVQGDWSKHMTARGEIQVFTRASQEHRVRLLLGVAFRF